MPLFEALEPRLLLSSSPAPAPGGDTNDQISEAPTVLAGSSWSGEISTSTDVDMIRVDVSANQTLGFDIDRGGGSGLDSFIRLFKSNGSELLSNDNATGPSPEPSKWDSYLEYTFQTPGSYYLGVSSLGNDSYDAVTGAGDTAGTTSGSFTLYVNNIDNDRFEPNDSAAAAHDFGALASPLTESGLICGTQDWYEFTMLDVGGPTDEVTITFSQSEGDLDIGLRELDGSLLISSTTSTDNETVSLDGIPAGTYHVQVVPFSGAFNPNYSLTIDPPPVDDDRFEPNDSAAAAHDFGALASPLTESGLICGTQDWYEFTMLDVGGPTDEVTITFSQSEGDLDIGLRELDGSLLVSSTTSTDNETVSLDGIPAGTYHVQVVPYSGAFNPNYSLTIDPPPGDNDRFEPNDSAAAAHDFGALASPLTESGLICGTQDWYEFTMLDVGGPTDEVTITFSQSEGDLDIGLRELDGSLLVSSTTSTDNETVSLDGIPAGTYHVQVVPYMGAFNPNYSLTIDPPSLTPPPVVNLVHPFNGESLSVDTINIHKRYIDVTFVDRSGSGLDAVTILDAAHEFTLSGAAAVGVTVKSPPTLIFGGTYRYYFAGDFLAGKVAVNFTAGSFADLAGNTNDAWAEGFTVVANQTHVAARHIFYNNSHLDGNNTLANADDDNAVDATKEALLPGGIVYPSNYTSYSRGINGIMVDIANLDAGYTPDIHDFGIRVHDAESDTWPDGPAGLSVSVRPVDGLDRVTLIWPDGAIHNQWVEVTVKSEANNGGGMGLAADDVFYFCNAIGDTDGDGAVGISDYTTFIGSFGRSEGVDRLEVDLNRDGRVVLDDFVIMRTNFGNEVATPGILTAPSTAPPAALQTVAEPSVAIAAPAVSQPLDDSNADDDTIAAAASVPVVDLLACPSPVEGGESPSAGGYILERRRILVGSSATTLHLAATSEYDLRPLSDNQVNYCEDDLLADILSESTLALPL
ncbi:MAG: pre-peptidase C-terminal domain-containing protein [Phycisphaerae bacterium]|nr:pre-peptidase C-terminal domain-containing protein [Phycisphaerae bacterium]